MATRISAVPQSKGLSRRDENGNLVPVDGFIRGAGGMSVEEAKAAMLAAKETATTTGGGTKVPKFIQDAANRGQGGNTPVRQPVQEAPAVVHTPQNPVEPPQPARNIEVSDAQTTRALRFNGQQKLNRAGYRNGQSVDLIAEIKKGTITKEEAEALSGQSIVLEDEPAEEPEVVESVVEAPKAEVPVQPVRVPVEEPTQAKKIETNEFVGQIWREGKDWIAEITYKNGAGTERFTANSKDELMLTMLEGKGNATLKVRKTSRELKELTLYGPQNDTWDFFFDEVKKSHNLTVEQYNALPEPSRALVQDTIQAQQILEFQQQYPEYYGIQANFEKIANFLNSRNWPLTTRNLTIAYSRLLEEGELEQRPASVAPTPKIDAAKLVAQETPVQTVAPKAEDSPSVEPAAPIAPAVQPAPVVRKRGTTGLIPGSSSAAPVAAARPEDGREQREPSVAELKAMPMADLKRIATKDRKYGRY